jgi:hypothetical protein
MMTKRSFLRPLISISGQFNLFVRPISSRSSLIRSLKPFNIHPDGIDGHVVEAYLSSSGEVLTDGVLSGFARLIRFLPERVVAGPGPSENKPYSPGLIEYINGSPPTTK